jgi:small subunit ribosomal protein S8
MQHDPLVDAMTGLKNAEQKGKLHCDVNPSSKLVGRVLNVMQAYGYIKQFEFVENGKGGLFSVTLNGSINKCGAIRPRYAVKKDGFEKFESRYLPAKDFGIMIVTTTKGVMSHAEAKKDGVGGKLLAYVF